MNLIEHAEDELKRAGYHIDKEPETITSDTEYADVVAQSALKLIREFSSQGHSGMSSAFTLNIFNQLARFKALTPLTNDPNEWQDVSQQTNEKTWQSTRQSSCFTHDMKTYYDIDDPDNNVFEVDENGESTGYATLKPRNERKMVELQEV